MTDLQTITLEVCSLCLNGTAGICNIKDCAFYRAELPQGFVQALFTEWDRPEPRSPLPRTLA